MGIDNQAYVSEREKDKARAAFRPKSHGVAWRWIFRWYDLWVGVFVDRKKRKVYVFPVPMIGVEIQLTTKQCPVRMSMAPWAYTAQCDLSEGHDGACVFEGTTPESDSTASTTHENPKSDVA